MAEPRPARAPHYTAAEVLRLRRDLADWYGGPQSVQYYANAIALGQQQIRPPGRARQLVEDLTRLRDTPAGLRLRNRELLREHAAEALRRSPDPLLREIGEHLRNGRGRPADVVRVPEYAAALGRATRDAAGRVTVQRLAEAVVACADRHGGESFTGRGRPDGRGTG